jgi:DNA-binding transcriptional MerR regulator
MTVGELSRRTGVPVKTLRQYADWGLVYTVGRSRSGYRLFDSEALWCVDMIGRLRALGLSLAEIRELTNLYLEGSEAFGPHLAERLHISRGRLTARIEELRQTLRRIDEFEAAYSDELIIEDAACLPGDPRRQRSA